MLLRTKATVVWAVLVALTTLSWMLGTTHGFGTGGHRPASVVILVFALFKARLVGLHFMDLRRAPTVLRALFEAWCAAVCAATIGLFLFA
ncbi:cytochrome C oxidase subunit IV family protein [Streptomyces sp. NBC_00829]|uniref:cytochrome C oxidase subunit IV family protein n=1 Tax=Streptomyces sp. NBC_00829 TaxID=2903679 RepID=UPI00386699DC